VSATAALTPAHLAAGAGFGLIGLAVCAGVALWARPALVALAFLIPFHRLAVAIVDHAGRWPADPVPDDALRAFLARSYYLDLSILAGLVGGALIVQTRRRSFPRPRWLVVVVAADAVAVGLLSVALGVHVPRAAAFSVMLTVAGPLSLLAALCIRPSARTTTAMRWAFVLAAAVLGGVALVEQRIGTRLPLWLGGAAPHADSAFYSGPDSTGYRSGSLLRTPLELAFFMAAALPLALTTLIASRRARPLATIAAGLVIAGLAVTYTRSSYLGAAVGLAVIAVAVVPPRRLRALAPAAVVAAIAATVLVAAGAGGAQLGHGDTGAHLDALGGDVDLVRQKPLGHGFGIIDTIGQQFDPAALPHHRSSEDLWMAKAVEGGVEGFALYASAVGAAAAALVVAARAGRRRGDRGLVLAPAGPLGALIAVAVAGIFLGIEDVSYLVPVWALAGAAASQRPAIDSAGLHAGA